MLLITILILILGLLGLYLGSRLTVLSLENIAERFGISHILIGLTILSIGTSFPEIAVSIIGGVDKVIGIKEGIDAMVIGNKVGSFFTNITLILGILGMSQKIFVSKWELHREGIMLFIAIFIFFIFSIDLVLTFVEGLILVISYIIYLVFIIKSEKKVQKMNEKIKEFIAEREGLDLTSLKEKEKKEKPIQPEYSYKRNIPLLVLGLLILLGSAEITLLSGENLAQLLDIPELIVGLLIISLGTSLPELCADLMALKRDSGGIAVGDIIGSNICNILLAAGSGVLIANFEVSLSILLFEIPMILIAISLVYFFLWRERTLTRYESLILIGFYVFYLIMNLIFITH